MSVRFLLDENVPIEVVAALAASGHDAERLPVSMRASDDIAVLAYAATERRVLVTLDTDFGALVFLHGRPPPPGIVLIRMSAVELTQRLAVVAAAMTDAAATAGRFIVIGPDGVRVRPLG